MSNEFSIGGREFKMSKIPAMKQFHLVRRIAPILADMLPAMKDVKSITKLGEASEGEKLEQIAKFVTPIMTGLSKLSDDDSDKVLFSLLSSVEIKQGGPGNWAKIANDQMIMMQDLELPILLQVAGRAFMFNLSGFFAVLPQSS